MTLAEVPAPPKNAPSRLRRLTPMTSWVALTPRANSTSAVGICSATIWWKLPPSDSTSARWSDSAAAVGSASPSGLATWTANSCAAAGALRDPRSTSQERVALGAAGQGDDDAFARLPGGLDAVLGSVGAERGVDLVGEPEQGELAQCGEVAEPEVVAQRRVDPGRPGRRVPATSRSRRAGGARSTNSTWSARRSTASGIVSRCGTPGDLLHDVVERLDVLDVDGRDDVDAGVEERLDVLPALRVVGAGGVGVGELVDERELGVAGEHGIQVHLVEPHAAVLDRATRHDLETLQERRGGRAAVGFHDRDDHIPTFGLQAPALLEHREGLADAGGGAEHDAQSAPSHGTQFVASARRMV